ncbi:hypothetical protein Cni_G13951 [Canna indica]|uniref:2-oxoglutarate (2OG) and Fe(II)-dependent oxygenase superfamily protein n=1 Tax=Canna indica TaxID=4628 RepID=A0AAQ3KC31_9LILI|nr:hypothetical protein Cni_G13951 [Canna indica]
MGAMVGSVLPSLGRIRLTDLIGSEGLPSESYKISVSTLTQSLAQYSAAIIELPPADSALLRSGLESARLFFHQCAYPPADMVHTNETREWCKTSGYYADPQLWQETYDYRPGLTPADPHNAMEFPPAGLPDIFAILGKAARDALEAISFSLNLRSFSFAEILDNMPLRSREITSSVLSVCCHSRPSFQGVQHNMAAQEEGQLVMFPDHEHQVDKSLITLVKSDRAGLHIKDLHGHWILVDGNLGPQDAIIYPGLALYQATAGHVSPAMLRIDVGNLQTHLFGRCSLAFKLMPRSMASLSCSEMRAAGYGVEAQFQMPITVDDFMQRSHSTDQFTKSNFPSYAIQPSQNASLKPHIKTKKDKTGRKPLPPSKKLRLEAQRVLKERVQDIAEKKGIKLRFCNLKECEGHMQSVDSPCSNIRMEIGWPPGVPFVHPHDLPNKAKLGFLEAYEPGWAASQQDMELLLAQRSQSP